MISFCQQLREDEKDQKKKAETPAYLGNKGKRSRRKTENMSR